MVLLFRAWCAVSVVASVSAKKKKKAATRTAFKDKHDPSRQAEDPNAAEVRNGLSDFVKLRVHQLIDYAKVVFLDADIMVRGNVDHLFWLPEGSHSDGPHAPFNACLLYTSPSPRD